METELSPSGPLVVLVSIPQQTMHVYRNGILIGRSSVSTGSKGHATPGGVFSSLEKKQEDYSADLDRRWDPILREARQRHRSPSGVGQSLQERDG